MKVLVVEDEVLIRKSMEQTLERAGMDVIPGNGEEAVKIAGGHQPNAFLMDIHLRGQMDGIESATEISRTGKSAIIVISAYNHKAQIQKQNTFHYLDYLNKPVRKTQLLEALSAAKGPI